jgi:uncharacterized protein (UPF0261 family)
MAKIIAIFAALDTKGEEAALIRDHIVSRGHTPLIVDVGVLAGSRMDADVTCEEVAQAGGADLEQLRAAAHKGNAMEVMTAGAGVVSARLYAEGRVDGAIGLGGTAGTVIGSSALRALPVGVPKFLVSTVASGDTRPYVGAKDIAMLYSVVDIAGLNRISTVVLTNAAGAICGMVEAEPPERDERPMIAASMFGNTTECVDHAREILDEAGYEVLVFHATGSGGQTMESLISDNVFAGSLDLTTTEWADQLCGGVFAAGPDRLDAAAAAGIPQVVAPGCLDMVNFGAPDTVPDHYKDRQLYRWNPNVTLMRTTPEENAELGRILAEKLNASQGRVAVLLPLKGVSQLDSPGGDFWDPDADDALFSAIRTHIRSDIPVSELDLNINDPGFAERAASLLQEMIAESNVPAS